MNTDKTQIREKKNDGVGRLNKLAYRDGYLHGQTDEHDIQQEHRIIRENNSAAKGLLIGIGLTAIAGLLGTTIFFLSHSTWRSPTPGKTAPVPTTNQLQNP
jgi:hypothetical protein